MTGRFRGPALFAILVAVSGCETARPPLSEPTAPGVFAVQLERAGTETACLATRLSRAWAVTAGHCWPGPGARVRARCSGGAATPVIGRVTGHVHPTHDVGLLRFPGQVPCAGVAAVVDRPAAGSGPVYTLVHMADGRRHAQTVAARVGPHVLTAPGAGPGASPCLPRGQSGAALFHRIDKLPPRLAGLLIAGAPRCPGPDVFVRVDRVRDWIDAQIQSTPGMADRGPADRIALGAGHGR